MKVGYARVSTDDHNLDLQVDALREAGCKKIFQEKASGMAASRPEFDRLREFIHEGDTLVVWKLDRVGRSTRQLVDFLDELRREGIEFVSLKDGFDTQTPAGKMMYSVIAAMAEFEHDLIVERTSAGLEAARARGRKGGRPKVDQEAVEIALKMHGSHDYTIKEIVTATGISQATLYKYLKERQ